MIDETVLVVGARRNSLGEAVAALATARGYRVLTAGQNDEQARYSATFETYGCPPPYEMFRQMKPDHVVCTVGVNGRQSWPSTRFQPAMINHFQSNVLLPLALAQAWQALDNSGQATWRHFVAISSNSASVARTESAPYCASKAALSMAVRCIAREQARQPHNDRLFYVYEPGLLAGTPMTSGLSTRGPLHRIPGAGHGGLDVENVAAAIVSGIRYGGLELNGACLRLDGGEQ